MGWWGKGILSGDSPLDAIWLFEKAVGLKGYVWTKKGADESKSEVIYPVEAMKPSVVEKLKSYIEKDDMRWLKIGQEKDYDKDIKVEVGAVIALAVGAKLSDEYKTKAVEIIQKDEWAQEDEERKKAIDVLCEAIKKSDGSKRIVLKAVGLMETIGSGMAGVKLRSEVYQEV